MHEIEHDERGLEASDTQRNDGVHEAHVDIGYLDRERRHHAGAVYELFGLKGVGVAKQPKIDQPVGHRIGYHIRTGKHDVTDFDWEQYLNFADRHLK